MQNMNHCKDSELFFWFKKLL